jgi:hypothetical protein
MDLKQTWRFIGDLFDMGDIDQNISAEIQRGNMKAGITRYLIGILLTLFTSFILATLAIAYMQFTYDSTSNIYPVQGPKPEITSGFIISSLIYFGLVMFPFLFLATFLHQGFIYAVMRILGGRGSFKNQYSITSHLTLTIGLASLFFIPAFALSFFLPCFNLFWILAFVVTVLYLALIVQTKMLMAIHHSKFLTAMFVVLIASIGSVVFYALVQLLVMKFGIGPDFAASFALPNIPALDSLPQMSGSSVTNLANATNITN